MRSAFVVRRVRNHILGEEPVAFEDRQDLDRIAAGVVDDTLAAKKNLA